MGSLPFEPEVVSNGDAGNMSFLDNDQLLITQEFNKTVDEIVKLTEAKEDLVPETQKDKELPMRKQPQQAQKYSRFLCPMENFRSFWPL